MKNSDVMATPEVTVGTDWTAQSLIASTKAVLVPEPATATLSLLALAGLAARRRRK
ncbi:MAG: PEP-CTERM sorting domain-containing protein [Akkermansia sp.]|nr:PEP-CTERM sorting domain-containing protein [Akkermansia sp.]